MDTKPENRQVAVLLHTIGEEALEKFNTFGLSDEDSRNLARVIDSFERYCTPKANESVDRHIFFARSQQTGESFDLFLTDLKKLSIPCGFGTLRDGLIKDRIISGLTDSNLKNRLLREDELDLDKCIRICKASELAQQQLKTLAVETAVHAVKAEKKITQANLSKKHPHRIQVRNSQRNYSQQAAAMTSRIPQGDTKGQHRDTKTCNRCATRHPLYQCPAYGKTCAKCKKLNHFARACNSNTKNRIEYIEQNNNDDSTEFFIDCVNTNSKDEWNEQLILCNKQRLTVKLDTGAQCNVFPLNIFNNLKLAKNRIIKSNAKLTKYGGTITVIGKCNLRCKTRKGKETYIEFQVVNEKAPAALGLPTIENLNLIKKINLIDCEKGSLKPPNKYKNFVQGSGLISDCEYDIKLKPNSVAHVEPCRRVPFKLRDPLQKELKRMEENQIIEKIHEPTEDGSLRICLDPHYST